MERVIKNKDKYLEANPNTKKAVCWPKWEAQKNIFPGVCERAYKKSEVFQTVPSMIKIKLHITGEDLIKMTMCRQ